MPSIDIRRKHSLPLKQAKAAVTKVAAGMAKKFEIESQWAGNTLNFSRPGVSGKIQVAANEVHVTAELGFLLGMLKPTIEREIESQMDAAIG